MMQESNSIHGIKARILVEALCELVKAGIPYSFYVSKMLWGVSLYLQCGDFVERWQTYPRISDAARKVREARQTDWRKQVTFEHAQPLNQIYRLLLSEGSSITSEKAVEIIGAYPPILITRAENIALNKRHKTDGAPEQRYREIPFSGFTLRTEPIYGLARRG
jgi:hypothetical protein